MHVPLLKRLLRSVASRRVARLRDSKPLPDSDTTLEQQQKWNILRSTFAVSRLASSSPVLHTSSWKSDEGVILKTVQTLNFCLEAAAGEILAEANRGNLPLRHAIKNE